jgi:outer membrane lipoprotein SlyB
MSDSVPHHISFLKISGKFFNHLQWGVSQEKRPPHFFGRISRRIGKQLLGTDLGGSAYGGIYGDGVSAAIGRTIARITAAVADAP